MDFLEAQVESLETENAGLRKQYQAKDRQYKQLSTAMHDKIHKDGDRTDDELIKKFTAFQIEIQNFLHRLFILGPVQWISPEYGLQDKEDQKSYLEHRIASLVSEHIFGRDGMARGIFGMEQAHEGTLSKLEKKFYKEGASEFDFLDGWRAQTVQLIRQTNSRSTDRPSKAFGDAFDQDVRRHLQLEAPQEEWLRQGILQLYARATEAALELRERKTRYVWAHAEEVRSTDAFEVEDQPLPLVKGVSGREGEQVELVLFGPLYRVEEDGRRLVIRAGSMLRWQYIASR
ncbi:hypothetical protein A1O3_07679 [Capronia epimyces CBS 606.96]|uniref:Uncharacterized protein n=1 Tax=Capronia epimyces CBS 606.96 TaxID=1182542 RepID=W9XMH2_9EURO|nr:uncharacterized protein A1O3_07679 [Capronia epimyces CBS 606.96]EXJ81388.1 hypothetical protein A1O3_07679 [Capronia epimyces CBS 606.96]